MVEAVAAFQDNYIWMIQNHGAKTVAVVDPGDAGPVIAALEHKGLRLTTILVTHHHADHTGGIDELMAYAYAKTPDQPVSVIAPREESIAGAHVHVVDGDEVMIDDQQIRLHVMAVPGHTRGHVAYFTQDPVDASGAPSLFCGDTLFAGGCGRLFEGTADQMWRSLQRLAALPGTTQVYCAHEYTLANLNFAQHAFPEHAGIRARLTTVKAMRAQGIMTVPSSIDLERQTNPFLLCTDAKEFAALRERKDQFRG